MKEENEQLIEKFLEESLSPEEVAIFKHTYTHDPEFAREVRDALDMEAFLKATWKTGMQPAKRGNIRSLWFYRLAASVTLLILSWTGYQWVDTPTPEMLAQEEFVNVRWDYDNTRGLEEDSLVGLYLKGDNNTTLQYLEQIRGERPGVGYYWFLTGDVHMEEGNYEEAITAYRQGLLLDSSDPDAQWNLAIAHLFKRDFSSARELFSEMADDKEHQYQKEALQVRRKIDRRMFKWKARVSGD